MAEVRPDEVSAILREQLSGFRSEAELEEKHKEQQEEKQEIDFLKKNRKRNKSIIAGCMVGAIVIAFAIILMNVYVIGDPVDGYTVDCFVQNTNRNLRFHQRMVRSQSPQKLPIIQIHSLH